MVIKNYLDKNIIGDKCMEPITFQNLSISGVSYQKLIDVNITQELNKHATAKIICEFDDKEANRLLATSDEGVVTITTSAKGQPNTLFYGIKKSVSIVGKNDYKVLQIELISTSYLLDKEKKERTFQNTKLSCEELMNKVAGGNAVIQFNVTDKAVGTFIYQHKETDWELLKRVASMVNAAISTNTTTEKPIITVGIPIGASNSNISKQDTIESGTEVGANDSTYQSMKSEQYMSVGAMIGGIGSNFIQASTSTITNGTLKTTYKTGSNEIFNQPQIINESISGTILTGTVQEVEKDKVKVFFDQIDSEFDSGSDTWFEYSTLYASNGGAEGSGFYFMPEVNDRVKVFFPSAAESTGFAFASECVSPLQNPKKVKWRAPGGQEILFTEKGIKITGKENSIYIELIASEYSEFGLNILSDKDINLNVLKGGSENMGDLYISGEEKVVLYGDEMILLRTPDAEVHIAPEKIVTGSRYFYIS